jgi:hypothetical protein
MPRFFPCLGIIAAAIACGQPAAMSPPTTNAPRDHVLVHFTDMHLSPSVAQLNRGGKLGWLNYASNYVGVVTFPKSVASRFTCSELRPMFSEAGTDIVSLPIRMDGMQNVVLPCPLQPGEYEYRVDLFADPQNLYDPQLTLPGRIIVK